jgi:hypothetical protein
VDHLKETQTLTDAIEREATDAANKAGAGGHLSDMSQADKASISA